MSSITYCENNSVTNLAKTCSDYRESENLDLGLRHWLAFQLKHLTDFIVNWIRRVTCPVVHQPSWRWSVKLTVYLETFPGLSEFLFKLDIWKWTSLWASFRHVWICIALLLWPWPLSIQELGSSCWSLPNWLHLIRQPLTVHMYFHNEPRQLL